jgi:UPF0716 protein FxsA
MARRLGQLTIGAAVLAVIELMIAIWLAGKIGAGWTLLILLALSTLGAVLLRREGLRSWRRFRAATNVGERPGPQVVHGLVGLAAALLLFIPGLLSGLAGLVSLIPPVRHALAGGLQNTAARRLSPRVMNDLFGPRQVRVHRGPTSPGGDAGGDAIEGEIV